MRVGIVGGGAIGLLLAGLLAKQKNSVTIYVRNNEQKDEINQHGIRCLSATRMNYVSALMIDELKDEDVIFICVKQYDLAALLPKFKNIISPLIFLQNGMDHINLIREMNISNPIIIGTCEHAAKKVNATTVNYTGKGQLNFALFQGEEKNLMQIKQQLVEDDFPIVITNDWQVMLHNKLIINSIINPITALFQVKNGALLSNPYLLTLAQKLCEEVSSELKLDAEEQWERVRKIIQNTGENESSMKTDIKNKRKTEIDGILGYLVERVDNTPKPLVNYYYQAIKAMEWENMQ